MKVLHISTSDSGGAGGCARKINAALCEEGVDSRILVHRKKSKDERVVQYRRLGYRIERLIKDLGFKTSEMKEISALKSKRPNVYTLPVSKHDLSSHPLVKEADIIHLHWINNFVDYPSFFRNVNKPIIWTLHDENLFHGVAHFYDPEIKNEAVEIKFRKLKEECLSELDNLHIVFLSEYMKRQYGNATVIANASKRVINNMVDCSTFVRLDKISAREKFGIKPESKVITFVADNISDPRKGLSNLLEAIRISGRNDIVVLAVGANRDGVDFGVVQTGRLSGANEMSAAYSAADLFVMPSLAEAFAQCPIEAMACGIPVVMTPVSGSDDLITEDNGIICTDMSVEALSVAINNALSRDYNPDYIRKDVESRFSPHAIASSYIDVYREALNMFKSK